MPLATPLFQHLGKRGSRLNVGRCQLIHGSVEHAQPLCHAVDGGPHLLIFPILMPREDGAGHAHRKLGNDRGEDGREGCVGNGGDDGRCPVGSKDRQRAETARKCNKANKHDQPRGARGGEREKHRPAR